MKLIYIIVCTIFLFNSCNQKSQPDPAVNKAFNDFLDKKFDDYLHRNPEFAASLGMKYNYGKWTDKSIEGSHRELKIKQEILDSLMDFDKSELDSQSLLSLRLYEEDVKNAVEGQKWEGYFYELNQMGGVVTDMPAFLINVHAIDTLTDAEAYIERLKDYKKPFHQTIENLKYSQSLGIAPPAFTFPYVQESIDNFIKSLSNPDNNDLINDFTTKVSSLTGLNPEKKTELIQAAKNAIAASVVPAYQDMGAYWKTYASTMKDTFGVWSLPKGDNFYKYCLKSNTTLDLTAEEVYQMGLKEVARIHDEMRVIMKTVKYKNDSLQDFFNFVRSDKQFQYSEDAAGRKALLADATKYFEETQKKLPEIFNTFPKAPCKVMAVESFREKSAGGAFYENPTLDGKRPGRYYVNLYSMKDNPKYQLEALTAHEAIPGHHMQIAIAQELTDIPQFRKNGGNTAYIEGWALYSEKLNKELGFYTDPYSDFGRLSMEIFRAARLVVDVGIHSKKWTRDQAVQYFLQNTANAEGDIRHEIERYFLWPGQATGYKIGMMKIMELKEKSKKKLGDKFDIRRFHDIVLKNGSVPLNVLEELVMN
jgi:uncharacterized protein (DUF885 family)